MKTSDYKKETLLSLAKNNQKKPSARSTLGRALARYLCITSNAYDRNFKNEIQSLAPNWFVIRSQINKKTLLKWAQSGIKKPTRSQTLGRALVSYTNPTQTMYDKRFTEQLKKIRPDWFSSI